MSKVIIIEGRNMVHDALTSDKKLKKVVISRESIGDPKIEEIIQLTKKKNVSFSILPSHEIRGIAQSQNPQNIIAEMEIEIPSLKKILDSKENPLILLFNRLDYEQNLGAILRTSWGAGVDAVIASPSGVHELTPVVTKVSMGGAAHVPLLGESLFPALKLIKDYGIPVVGVEEDLGEPYFSQELRGPVAFVFGGEDSGLSEPLRKYCDIFIHIPMKSGLSSLNVSVATALIVFEKMRQERE